MNTWEYHRQLTEEDEEESFLSQSSPASVSSSGYEATSEEEAEGVGAVGGPPAGAGGDGPGAADAGAGGDGV